MLNRSPAGTRKSQELRPCTPKEKRQNQGVVSLAFGQSDTPLILHTSRSYAATSKPAPHKAFVYGIGFEMHTVKNDDKMA